MTVDEGSSMLNDARPVHPGEILRERLEEIGLSANALAGCLRVPTNRVTSILKEQRSITADTALRLAKYFGPSAEFWMNLQSTYDLMMARVKNGDRIAEEVQARVI